jgi:dCTP deaminase
MLTGPAIRSAVEAGTIKIDPYDPDLVNPASVDVRLGNKVGVYTDWVECYEPGYGKVSGMSPEDGVYFRPLANILDTKKKPSFRVYDINPECGWVLKPGIGYLMHTLERVSSDFYDPVLDGKSSIGRLFIAVHITAGYGDPGFPGNWTLEVTAQHPVRVYPGMCIGQIRFEPLQGEIELYDGHYTDEAIGPVASRAYQQFRL